MKPNLKGLHHDHVDGSMAVMDVIDELYRLAGTPFPFSSKEAWLAFFQNPQEDILARFNTVTSVLQSKDTLEMLGYTYGKRRSQEGYEYVEGKFAPQYHTTQGLTLRQVADAMYAGMQRAEKEFGITIVPVICIGREASPDLGIEIAKIAIDYGGEAILDLVCDEAGHPPEKHLPAYEMTFGTSVIRDCHAGEWVSKEPSATYHNRLLKNVRTALFDLRCHSIGHAIPLGKHPDLVHYVRDHGIRVAGCPLSNLRSGLIQDLRELRIDYMLDQGVCYTLNPDDDLFFPRMDDVIAECDAAYNFTPEQCRKLEANVFLGGFGLRKTK